MVDCKEYENKLWDLKPKDNELIEYVGFSCDDLKKFLNTLDKKNRLLFAILGLMSIYKSREQDQEIKALKPVIEKEIDPDFFKPRAQGIIR